MTSKSLGPVARVNFSMNRIIIFIKTGGTSGETHIRLDGIMVELLAIINPKIYQKFILSYEKGRKILYGLCLK